MSERKKVEHLNKNDFTNRTVNAIHDLSKNKLNDDHNNTDILALKERHQSILDKTKSKYLETSTNDNNETYNDINKKIFEVEKVLQLVKNQDKKIQMIKDKLDKKMKNSS